MNCEQVKDYLSPYLDNALTPEERLYVASHLETCANCRQVLTDFIRFDSLLSSLPRVGPPPNLRDRIFSSQDYLELSGLSPLPSPDGGQSLPVQGGRPHFVSLPGGRRPAAETQKMPAMHQAPDKKNLSPWRQRFLYSLIAASIVLTVTLGGLISWKFWLRQLYTTLPPTAITPPAALPQQNPLPAGTRFLFLHAGALWSCADDDKHSLVRLTPENVIVGPGWSVRAGLNGHHSGNLIAYIDIQHGSLHLIRSDGQNDISLPQPLLPKAALNAHIWQTSTGLAILNNLSWAPDGSTLAFLSGDLQQSHLYFFHPSANSLDEAPLPSQSVINKLTWSPDGTYLAFTLTHQNSQSLVAYAPQRKNLFTVAAQVNDKPSLFDAVLSIGWDPNPLHSTLTWSIGSAGHIHAIWMRQVSTHDLFPPLLLKSGDYPQASYNQAASWLFVAPLDGLPGDIYTVNSVNFSARVTRLTLGRKVTAAQWSPDGRFISYFDAFSSQTGILHLIDTQTQLDTVISNDVAAQPLPAWSLDQQELAYCIKSSLSIVHNQTWKAPFTIDLPGQITMLSWSNNHPSQAFLTLDDAHKGLYLVDSYKQSSQQITTTPVEGTIQWSQIP